MHSAKARKLLMIPTRNLRSKLDIKSRWSGQLSTVNCKITPRSFLNILISTEAWAVTLNFSVQPRFNFFPTQNVKRSFHLRTLLNCQ